MTSAREGEENADCPFVFIKTLSRKRSAGEYAWHTRDIAWRNVTVDFKSGGGNRHRPGSPHRSFNFGTVDRIVIDKDCRIYGHLCQNANPKYTVGPVWRNRDRSGPMYGIDLWVYERALIDGVWSEADYAAWRTGGVATEDAFVEWRMDLPEAGYGDLFWMGPGQYGNPEPGLTTPAGHFIMRDTRIEGHRTGALWNDYGLKMVGEWKSVLVEDSVDPQARPSHCLHEQGRPHSRRRHDPPLRTGADQRRRAGRHDPQPL